MVTNRQLWIGFAILLCVLLLVMAAMMYWSHVTHTSFPHTLASIISPESD